MVHLSVEPLLTKSNEQLLDGGTIVESVIHLLLAGQRFSAHPSTAFFGKIPSRVGATAGISPGSMVYRTVCSAVEPRRISAVFRVEVIVATVRRAPAEAGLCPYSSDQ